MGGLQMSLTIPQFLITDLECAGASVDFDENESTSVQVFELSPGDEQAPHFLA